MITLTREEAQQVLEHLDDLVDAQQWEIDMHITQYGEEYKPHRVKRMREQLANTNSTIETLRARLSAPEPNIVQDAIVYGTGITMGGKRIDPASIYKGPEPPCKTGSQCIGGKCPQCVVSEPEPVAQDGSWVSAHKSCVQDCWCHKCNEHTVVKVGGYDIPYKATTMILCPDCGNKRCPKANDHDNACTGSNELGQPGSAYADVVPPQREWKELTTAETKALWNATKKAGAFAALLSAKLKEKNNG